MNDEGIDLIDVFILIFRKCFKLIHPKEFQQKLH